MYRLVTLTLLLFPCPSLLAQAAFPPTGANPEQITISVRDYGAVGDGVTDDYDALKSAAAQLSAAGGGTLLFPPGNYRIDRYRILGPNPNGVTNITFQNCDGLTIRGDNARIDVKGDYHRAADSLSGSYWTSHSTSVIPVALLDCNNVIIEGLELDGNADQMTRDPLVIEGYAHGIVSTSSSNYLIRDVYTHHFPSDGLYLGRSGTVSDRNVTLLNVRSSHNGRQGLSVIHVRDATIQGSTFEDTGLTEGAYGGHAPQAGVNIEPPPLGEIDAMTGNILLDGCTLRNNQGAQFQSRGTNKENLTLRGCTVDMASSAFDNSVILVVPNGILEDSDLVVRQIVPSSEGFEGCSTYIRNNRIRTDYRGITDYVTDTQATVVIEGNQITGTHTVPATTLMPYIRNTSTVFRNNTVFVPSAAKSASTATPISALYAVQRSEANLFQTDYVSENGGHFATDYGSTPTVVNDIYGSGAAFLPWAGSSWDTSVPYNRDLIAPSVSLTEPSAGAVLDGTVNLAATTSDNVGVTSVTFYAGDTLIATDAAEPYAVAWDTTTMANGPYSLRAVAVDASGNSASSTVNIAVDNADSEAPTVFITYPTNGMKVGGQLNVTVQAEDNVGVVKVELYADGKLVGASTVSPFTIKWNASKVSKGAHSLTARAYDAAGNTGNSPAVSVTK